LEVLKALSQVPGIYVPSLYTVMYAAPDGPIVGVEPSEEGVPARVINSMFPECSLNALSMFPKCSLDR
jgi:hypothetical protein